MRYSSRLICVKRLNSPDTFWTDDLYIINVFDIPPFFLYFSRITLYILFTVCTIFIPRFELWRRRDYNLLLYLFFTSFYLLHTNIPFFFSFLSIPILYCVFFLFFINPLFLYCIIKILYPPKDFHLSRGIVTHNAKYVFL